MWFGDVPWLQRVKVTCNTSLILSQKHLPLSVIFHLTFWPSAVLSLCDFIFNGFEKHAHTCVRLWCNRKYISSMTTLMHGIKICCNDDARTILNLKHKKVHVRVCLGKKAVITFIINMNLTPDTIWPWVCNNPPEPSFFCLCCSAFLPNRVKWENEVKR